MDESQEKALEILGRIQESMVKSLIDDLVQNEDSYTGGSGPESAYSFSLQDLEDKYAMKLWNIQRFINEVYRLNSTGDLPDHKVDIVFSDKQNLGEAINRRLEQLRPISLIDVKIQREDNGEYMAMIVFSPFDPSARAPEA